MSQLITLATVATQPFWVGRVITVTVRAWKLEKQEGGLMDSVLSVDSHIIFPFRIDVLTNEFGNNMHADISSINLPKETAKKVL